MPLPVTRQRTSLSNHFLIFSVFIVASCGLAYELIAAALASYLHGDSILQFSSIIGCYLFAMGVGSHLSKYVKDDNVLERFIDVELLVGLLGGVSATVLFLTFAWLGTPFRTVLYALVLIIGILVGMEIPLVMRVLNQRRTEFRELVSRVLTFDYLGALAVSLLFPLLLAPKLGMSRTALLFGLLNAGIAIMTAIVFRSWLPRPRYDAIRLRAFFVLFILGLGFIVSDRLTHWAEQGVFGSPIIYAETTPYQRIVITKWRDDLRLYLNSNLQFSSRDEHRYHEALVHPAMQALPAARRVLVLGGGDGLAVRELLKYKQIETITLIDLDPAMTSLFASSPMLTTLNQHSLTNPIVKIVNADAAQWMENNADVFDLIVIDLPDPSNYALGKLYSVPIYRLVAQHLSDNGYVVVQSTSPYYAPRAFWCIVATLKAAGFHTWPYHAYVPSFGEWGYIIGGKHNRFIPPTHYAVPTRFLDGTTTKLMFDFPEDMPPLEVEPNHLNTQILVQYYEQEWHNSAR